MNELVFNAENRFKHAGELIHEMFRDLKKSRGIALGLLIRNLRSEYRQLFLGRLWAFIPGLTAAFVVVRIRRVGILHVGNTEIPYPAYVVLGLLLWQTLVEALQGPIQAVSSDRALIRTQLVPVESLILAKQAEIILNFGIKFLLIMIILLWFGVSIKWSTFLLPFALLSTIIFATSIGLVLAPFNVLYQDVSKVVTFFSTLWLFFTPIIYPKPLKGVFATIVNLNPATSLLVTMRELVTSSHLTHLYSFTIVTIASLIGLLIAWTIFRAILPFTIERLNH